MAYENTLMPIWTNNFLVRFEDNITIYNGTLYNIMNGVNILNNIYDLCMYPNIELCGEGLNIILLKKCIFEWDLNSRTPALHHSVNARLQSLD